jgi:hypothetical protein
MREIRNSNSILVRKGKGMISLGELCAGDRIFKNMAWELRL